MKKNCLLILFLIIGFKISAQSSTYSLEQAVQYALENNRKQVTIVHKSNIMKKSDGMFLAVAREAAKKYPRY